MTEYFGFFSILGKGGYVRNLNIENANIGYTDECTNISAGIIAGTVYSATIENCNVSGTVKGNYYVGGLVGQSSYDSKITGDEISSEIFNSRADVEVFGDDWIGGFIGSNHRTIIRNCLAKGIVTCDRTRDIKEMPMGIGGFTGHNIWAEIRNCGASVWVKTMVNARCVGSFDGLNEGEIYDSFYNSDVSHWKPSGDSSRDYQNGVMGLSHDEYYERLSGMY